MPIKAFVSASATLLEDLEYTGRNVVPVRKHSHLQGPVGTAGEDPVTRAGFDFHHASADVSEYGLFSVFGAEGVHEPVTCQLPDLHVAFSRAGDKEVLSGVQGQSFDG